MPNNVLITGLPGVGKTTIVKVLFQKLQYLNPVGFYTREVRDSGIRRGFELVSLDGRRALLSHVNIDSPHRVGKYRVDLHGFERFLAALNLSAATSQVVVIDEIGKMECLSPAFVTLIEETLDSRTQLIATIALKGGGIIGKTRDRNDARLFHITPDNRDTIVDYILAAVTRRP